MNVRIKGQTQLAQLIAIDYATGIEWTETLINAEELNHDEFGIVTITPNEFLFWSQYIADEKKTGEEMAILAKEIGLLRRI